MVLNQKSNAQHQPPSSGLVQHAIARRDTTDSCIALSTELDEAQKYAQEFLTLVQVPASDMPSDVDPDHVG